MNADDFIPLLGKADDHPDLQRVLTRLKVGKVPKPVRGDTETRMVASTGVELVFAPADGNPRHGLHLVRVGFAGTGRGFTGTLPFELGFADSRKEARKKIGPPMVMDDRTDSDTWHYQSHTLVVRYSGGRTAVAQVAVSLPQDDDDGD